MFLLPCEADGYKLQQHSRRGKCQGRAHSLPLPLSLCKPTIVPHPTLLQPLYIGIGTKKIVSGEKLTYIMKLNLGMLVLCIFYCEVIVFMLLLVRL